jgi:GWxTD domain-containing protein
MKRLLAILTIAVIAVTSMGVAQRITASGRFVLNLDYAKFRNNDSTGYLEIYYGFYPRLITYDLINGRFVGLLKVYTRIKDTLTQSYLVNNVSNVPVAVADTTEQSLRSTFVTQAGHLLPNGEYTLEVVVIDSLTPSRRDGIRLPISMKAYTGTVESSDLELCSNIRASDQKNELFYKNSLEVMPNPTLIFGVASHPMMFSYAEIYNLNLEQTYTVKTQVVGQDGKVVKEASKSRKYAVKNAVEAGTTNVASIPSGKYRFRLTIADDTGNAVVQTEKTFYIYNPHIQGAQVSSVSIKASELAGLTGDELAEEFRRAQYVATDPELKTFSQITSAEGRREFLAKFWTEVEVGRMGRSGIPRMAYLQRVSTANQRFRAMSREGWRTDRGRVFIIYSEPDEIERFPSSENSKPYEIWNYYGIENGVQFVFVDRSGFGDFVLVHSTKRGELRDDEWQRFLQ